MLDDERSATRRRLLPVVLCIAIGASLGVWHNAAVARGANDPFTVAARTVLAPIVAATGATSRWVGNAFGSLGQGRRLARENAALRRKVDTLTAEVLSLRESAITAARLQSELGFLSERRPARLPARVLALNPSPHVATLVIDRGTRSGVRSGSVVLAPSGLVGHVMDATPTTATVLLASDPRCAVGAMVQRAESRAVGVCRGGGGRTLSLSYLSRDADVRPGDTLITSGLGGPGGIYPKGLVIGSVTRVTEDLATSAKIAIVRQGAAADRLEEVAVLR